MGYPIKAQETELPQNRFLRGALLKGAMAWREGRARDANPYVGDSFFGRSFCRAWDEGWILAQAGVIEVSWRA